MENVRKHKDTKLVTTDKRRNQLGSEPNYHTTKYFSKNVMAIKMKKTKVKMNKLVYLGMSTFDIRETLMHEFWFDYIKPKYQWSQTQWNCIQQSYTQGRAELCDMDTDSFVIHIKIKYFYKCIANDIEKWFDTPNFDEDGERLVPIGKNKNVIRLFKDELCLTYV